MRLFQMFNFDRISSLFELPHIKITDVVEVIIISWFIYQATKWVRDTRAWVLFKGLGVILGVTLLASIFQLNTVLWLLSNTLDVGIIAIIIVFQPELRRILEQLGRKNILNSIISLDDQKKERFSDLTITELVKAVKEMAKVKTGALIVIERDESLDEYASTGIPIDAVLSSQLLINIFEHNTPLHDGAIIVRGNRILSATCYLPLSDTKISKELGTRHRAALGVSEATDALTIIVSEETGKTSLALDGKLERAINDETLIKRLVYVQNKQEENKKFRLWKGRGKNEKANNK